jgi:membrane associated rhomboid family serine protease
VLDEVVVVKLKNRVQTMLGRARMLVLGVTSSFFVVLQKVTHSLALSGTVSGLLLALFYRLWFGYTSCVRATGESHARAN